jgi:uncharacterized protein (DUF433 family)
MTARSGGNPFAGRKLFAKGDERTMAFVETRYEHVVLDDTGVAYVGGTGMKVIELVNSWQAYGWSPEELHFQYPQLSLGQIHSALAYYWDHQAALDTAIRSQLTEVDALRRSTPPVPLAARVRPHP